MKIVTLFYPTDIKSKNGNIYPKDIVQKAINKYMKEKIAYCSGLGGLVKDTFDDNETVNFTSISHQVKDVKEVPDGFDITFKTLDTPSGKLLNELIDKTKCRPFIRGKGIVEGNIVKELEIISIDIGPEKYKRNL